MQVADNLPLYGVCCYMDELVHRPPTVLRSTDSLLTPLSRYLVAAPRCYCFLTHYPFFPLHFKVTTSPHHCKLSLSFAPPMICRCCYFTSQPVVAPTQQCL